VIDETQKEVITKQEEDIAQTKKIVWREFVKNYLFLLGVVGSIVGLDQFTKTLVRMNLAFGETWNPFVWLEPYARIVHWQNMGAAFGLGHTLNLNLVLMILAVIVIAVIFYYFPQIEREDWALRVALAMQMGGAAGNLIDRVRIGWVTDFISVGNFPVFNVADSSITVGVGILLLGIFLKERVHKAQQIAEKAEIEIAEDDLVAETSLKEREDG
jgi:signal peptidase II